MDLKGKRVLVVGLAKTGEALCEFLLNQGATVKVSEKKKPADLGSNIQSWTQKGVTVEAGGHERSSFLDADLIVPSPGVPPLPELEEARARGIKVISEVELAYRFLKGKIIGITGSNGKSTTTTLAYKILKEGGLKTYLAGNIETPLIQFVEQSHSDDIYVTELSSFQLRYIEQFRALISVFLNISPDHLDWHKTFNDYFESKKNLIAKQRESDTTILNKDDPLVWDLEKKGKPRVYAFSRMGKIPRGCYLQTNWIILSDDNQKEKLIKTSEIPLLGIHNQENVMAASIIGYLTGIPPTSIRSSIKSFKGLEHRLEKVLTLRGVEFYNDSKATNVDAALKSIQSFDRKIILILGGRDKGSDFRKLKNTIEEKVKRVILIGETKEKIEHALGNSGAINKVSSLKDAVSIAFSGAEPGEVILLAPACTSFDMFQNFEERGRAFKQEVFNLKERLNKEMR